MIRTIVSTLRVIQIIWIGLRYGLEALILDMPVFRGIRFLRYANPLRWIRPTDSQPQAVRLRLALEALGPIFIKFGQNLATRPDLISADLALELARLQDHVPPFPTAWAIARIEKSLGQTIEHTFAHFDSIPLASASMAQVHAATLKTGEQVVVKVLRPGLEKILQRDLHLLHRLAQWAQNSHPVLRRMRPVEVVHEFEYTILHELDLLREAAHASQLRRNFAGSRFLHVPQIYWHLTRPDLLVTERLYGIPVTDLPRLRAMGVDVRLLAKRGVDIFFTQVFRDAYFHGDMHAGNLFVQADNPRDPIFQVVDFGIMGSLQPRDQHYLAHNMLAFLNRDYRRVAELHVASGWVPAGTRIDLFESAIRTVCEPMFEQPLKDMSFGQLLLQLFQTAREFQMELLPQLVLLQKTLINIEGLARQLDPELDIWTEARPIIEQWMKREMGLRGFWEKLKHQWPIILERLPELPELLYEALYTIAKRP